MKTRELLALIFHLIVLLLGDAGRVMSESGNDTLYQTMLQEFYTMLSQVEPYVPFGKTSCQNSCHEDTENVRRSGDECHCDKHCVAFRDCCLDYWQSCNASFLEAFNHTQQFECLEPTLKLSNRTKMDRPGALGYQVITKCPETFQDPELKRKCENPVPYKSSPFVDGKDGITYKNVDCALCNGIGNWRGWNTSLACDNSTVQLIQERLESREFSFTHEEREIIRNTCDVKMNPANDSNVFECRIIFECQDKTNPDFFKCLSYKQQLYSLFTQTVRNPHCARCSGTPLFLLSLFQMTQGTEDNKNSLAILFDFSKASEIYGSEEIEQTQNCPEGKLYDFQQKLCRKLRFRSAIFENNNWTCEFMNETFPNSSKFIVVYENGSIFIPAHRRVYELKYYYWHKENVTVCGNFTKHFSKFTKTSAPQLYSNAEFNLTVIGYTLSILSLLLVLLTYSLFNELRTLPGKITMCLALALLLCQVVFLVDIFEEFSGGSCKGIAVILHYLYLASFCWMTVLAFNVAKTFASKGRRSQTHTQKRAFVLCSLYAWSLPLLLVSIALGVDNSGAMDVGYGNAYYCWITNPWALAIFFIVPVMIMLVFNIIALVLVLVLIRRERKITKTVIDKSTTKQDFSICWKLTAVFGLTWVLGLGAPYHIALRIAFILCNSLQGFFLMVGFIMTRRTLNLYLRMTGMRPLISRTAPTRSTMSSTKTSRRRRSSASVGKAWVKSKPATNQQLVPEGLKEIGAVKKCVHLPEPTEIKTIETNV